MTGPFGGWTAFLLLGFQTLAGQVAPWLTDDQAREVAEAAIRSVYPEPCYSTYRSERLEGFVTNLRRDPLVGNRLNNSVYFYSVASDACDYVVEKDGKPVRMTQVSMDCCEYGIVAVDRGARRSYWFAGEKRSEIFREFARDEQIHPDSPQPSLFIALYIELVWQDPTSNELRSLGQLRGLVQQNFRSAYSPYERDNVWERKFERWWKRFRSKMPKLDLETTYELANDGTKVRGPKGTPNLTQWSFLVKSDGTVERLPSTVIYSAR